MFFFLGAIDMASINTTRTPQSLLSFFIRFLFFASSKFKGLLNMLSSLFFPRFKTHRESFHIPREQYSQIICLQNTKNPKPCVDTAIGC